MADTLIGVQTEDLPTIKAAGITGAALNRANLIGNFERGRRKVVSVSSFPEAALAFGAKQSSMYGMFVLESLFTNLDGIAGVVNVRRSIADDAVAAFLNVNNTHGTPASVLKVKAGQLGDEDPGTWANASLGFLMLASSRLTTKLTAIASSATLISVEAAPEYEVGDIISVNGTLTKVTKVDQLNGQLTVSIAVSGAVDAPVAVVDRTIKVYRKDLTTGMITLVETLKNLTTMSDSAYYFLLRVNSSDFGSRYLALEHLTTPSAGLVTDLPAVVVDSIANITWLASGTNGTAMTEVTDLALVDEFDSQTILTTHSERFTETWNDALEAKCYNNGNGKRVNIGTAPMSTAAVTADVLAFARRRRLSRKVHALYNGAWLQVDDPTGLGPNAKKNIPNVGAIIGFTIQEHVRRGVHKVPASRKKGLLGIRGLTHEINNSVDFTPLADVGMNWITTDGTNYHIRSARTPSKEKEFVFFNGMFMSCYFKVTFENDQVIAQLENETDTEAILKSLRNGMQAFASVIHKGSTNGGLESGFAKFVKPDGTVTGFNDVVRIVADQTINPFDDVTAGIIRAKFYFMAPTPAERFVIGVGLLFQL